MTKQYNYFFIEIIIEMILKKLLSRQAIKQTNQYKNANQIKKVPKQNMLINPKTKTVFISPYHVQPQPQPLYHERHSNRK